MDTWGAVQFGMMALPLVLAALIGHFYSKHRRTVQDKGLAVLKAVHADNEPLEGGRRTVAGVVRARTEKPPIEGFIAYQEQARSRTWRQVQRKLQARSFDLVLEDSSEVVRVDLRRGTQWTLQAASNTERVSWGYVRERVEVKDGERVAVEGTLRRRKKKVAEGYRGAPASEWSLRADTQPIRITAQSAARAHTATQWWPLHFSFFTVLLTMVAAINLGALAVSEKTAQHLPGIARVYEATEIDHRSKKPHTVTLMDIEYTNASGAAEVCSGLMGRRGVATGHEVVVRASVLMPDACYEAGHYQASTGRFVLGTTLAGMLAVLAAIAFLKRRAGFFRSHPWFER